MWTVPADDPRYEGDRHRAGPIERAVDKAVEAVTGRCRWACGDVQCPEECRNLNSLDETGATLDPPPRAKPYRPPGRKRTTTSSSSEGTAMSIEEVRAGIGQATDQAQEGLGALQQAHAGIEQASGLFQQSTEGSGQADVSETTGLLAQAIQAIGEAQQYVQAAVQAAETVAARL